MKTKDIIRELKNIEEKYADEKLMTFDVSRSSMARDCRNKIEELAEENSTLKHYLTRGGFIKDRNGKWCKDGDKVLLAYRRDLDIDCIEGTLDWTGCNFNVILPNVKCHDWINLHSRFSFELTKPCEPDICKDFEEV